MTAPARTVRLRILGRVQGVGYRAWAIRMAASLALDGWVRNRSDGSVEMLVTGAGGVVAAMMEACRHGPAGACVTAFEVAETEADGSVGFTAQSTE